MSGKPVKLMSKVPKHVISAAIRNATHEKLLKRQHQAKDFQIDASTRIAAGEDTILLAPTGSGKTLVLAMPLLYHTNKTSIVISPL
jgi:Lhr-like helicase